MQEREKSSTDELPTRFAVKVFCPTSRSSQESEGFFYRQATYKATYVEAVKSARAGLSPKKGGREKEKKKTKEGKKVAPQRQGFMCPQPRISFFGSRVFGFGSGPSHLKYRLLRDLVYEEAMCEGSSRNELPYTAKAVP